MPAQLHTLSNSQLLAALKRLNDSEHEATLKILLHLIEVEDRKLYAEQGYPSMYTFCLEKLHYSRGSSYRRTQCARIIRDYPVAYRLLTSRKVSLVTLSAVKSILTPENSHEIFSAIINKSQEEVEVFVSSFKPKIKSLKETVKAVFVRPPTSRFQTSSPALFSKPEFETTSQAKAHCGLLPKIPESLMTECKYDLRFSVSKDTMEKLNRARMFMKFKAAASLEDTFDALLDFFLMHKDPVKKSQRRAMRAAGKTSPGMHIRKTTRYIPSRTKEEVFVQGQGRCEYVSASGRRCTEIRNLQYDHVRPFAAGGGHESENLRLLCPAHNRLLAERFFGGKYLQGQRKPLSLRVKEGVVPYSRDAILQ